MARTVDPRRTRKALRTVRKLAEAEAAEPLSDWEKQFLGEVGERLEKYGSAFNDYAKGAPDDALSRLQDVKMREIAAKARGKVRKGLTTRKPLRARRPDWAAPRSEEDDGG